MLDANTTQAVLTDECLKMHPCRQLIKNSRVAEPLNLEIQSHELIKHSEYTRFSRLQIYRNWFRL
jgi:hypothetical protein